ncbi:MAG: lysophospholipid acyltransferase family protein [Rickettsiales bacterium]
MKKNRINSKIFLRSVIFNFSFFLSTLFIAFFGLFLAFFSKKLAKIVGYSWGVTTLYLAKVICKINYEIEGLENLPKHNQFIIASKHESTWDTAFFLAILNNPVYILKKELLFIPLFGLHLMLMGMIAINRSKGKKSIKEISQKSQDVINKSARPIVIFPQGTRTKPFEKRTYKTGIYAIAKDTRVSSYPVMLNSGICWSKGSFFKHPGTINVKIMPAVDYAQNKEQYMKKIEEDIEYHYTKSKKYI